MSQTHNFRAPAERSQCAETNSRIYTVKGTERAHPDLLYSALERACNAMRVNTVRKAPKTESSDVRQAQFNLERTEQTTSGCESQHCGHCGRAKQRQETLSA